MNESLKKALGFVGLCLFACAFVWAGDVHSYLDQSFWHTDKIMQQHGALAMVYAFFFWPIGWIVSFMIAAIPFFAVGIFVGLARAKEYAAKAAKAAKEQQIIDAKKASNLYINTNGSASVEDRR